MMRFLISGQSCTGTSTLAKALAGCFECPQWSTGDQIDQKALELGRVFDDKFIDWLDTQPHIDHELDEKRNKFIAEHPVCVVESRLAAALCPIRDHSTLRILLTCDWITRVTREAIRRNVHLNQAADTLGTRDRRDRARFVVRYGAEVVQAMLNRDNYDLLLDSSKLLPRQLLAEVVKKVEQSLGV